MTHQPSTKTWRPVQHPLAIVFAKGWTWGRGCLISPRGTVFSIRYTRAGLMAQQRREFQLVED